MKSPEIALRIASVIAGLVGAAHLVRLALDIPVKVGSLEVSLWPSGMVVIVAGALSVRFWQLASNLAKSPPRP